MLTGSELSSLAGHFEAVTACVYRPHRSELLSAGEDRQLLCWLPARNAANVARQRSMLSLFDNNNNNNNANNVNGVLHGDDGDDDDDARNGWSNNLVAAQFRDQDEWSDDDS
jgi:hypothetical protein